ncbi:MAG: hypothetical protein AAF251_17130 [Pseudomonadota bacterium]
MRAATTLLALVFALILAGCTSNETFRYRMTVEVETPEGVRTGSSVREVEIWERVGDTMIGNKVGGKVRGEAVAVDLPNGKTLYMLLGDARWLAHQAIETPPPGPGHHLWGVKRARWMVENKAKGELPRGRYPMTVTSDDPRDPRAFFELDPEDLGANLGPGYSLKRVTIEITNDPLTRGMEKRLPEPIGDGFYGRRIIIDGEEKVARIGRSQFSLGTKE